MAHACAQARYEQAFEAARAKPGEAEALARIGALSEVQPHNKQRQFDEACQPDLIEVRLNLADLGVSRQSRPGVLELYKGALGVLGALWLYGEQVTVM